MYTDIDQGGNFGNRWKPELLVRVGRVLAGALDLVRASGDPAPIGLGLLVTRRGRVERWAAHRAACWFPVCCVLCTRLPILP